MKKNTPGRVMQKVKSILFYCLAVSAIVGTGALFPPVLSSVVYGATFVVDSTDDAVDANPGDGVCSTAGGKCTLRAAIQEANALAGDDVIHVPGGTYLLTITGINEDASAKGDLDITSNLSIMGIGETCAIIDGGQIDRVFHIMGNANVVFDNITIRRGGNLSLYFGGGVYNQNGTVTIKNSTLDSNSAQFYGGGIQNKATMIIENSTFTGNSATSGGGIFNAFGTLMITNSTFTNNTGRFFGGGTFNYKGTQTMVNSTLAENLSSLAGGGLSNNSGTVKLKNTIIANNTAPNGPNCYGTITSLGNNLINSLSGCILIGGGGDIIGQDPGLAAFINPGIPGRGHFPLLEDSPAIDAGNNDSCPEDDQIGKVRPVDGDDDDIARCDIGAIEFFFILNDLISLIDSSTSFDPTPAEGGPAGTFTVTAMFTNTSGTPIQFPVFKVTELTGGNLLLNADQCAGGAGAILTPDVGADRILSPGESLTVSFVIGLQAVTPFSFEFDLLGAPGS